MQIRFKSKQSSTRMAKDKTLQRPSSGSKAEQLEILLIAEGDRKRYRHFGKEFARFL